MYIKALHVSDFRIWAQASIHLGSGFNYIYGDNGAGKTALLEAVCLLSRGRSFRAGGASSLIRHAQTHTTVRAELDSGASLGLQKDGKGNTQLRLNGQSATRMSDLARVLPTHVLLPDSSELVFASPSVRRRFMDWGLFHVEQSYLADSRAYQKALSQRNAWLRTQPRSYESDPWKAQLIELGVRINERRAGYLARLSGAFEDAMAVLAPELKVASDYYWGGFESAELAPKKMSESFQRDVKLGASQRGPHRADMRILFAGANAADTLSRGQAKVVASALVLAQAELARSTTGSGSVILIDDFGAELDQAHWRSFLSLLARLDCQVIATSTEAPSVHPPWDPTLKCDVFHVKQGELVHESRAS